MTLKGGFTSHDRRLDRLVQFDVRSRGFGIMAAIEPLEARNLRSYTWSVAGWLDQGTEGECVQYAICHELLARPVAVEPLTVAAVLTSKQIYHPAQHDDYWDGCYLGPRCPIEPSNEQYEGTSVLAGIKAAAKLGFFGEYRWAFGVHELCAAVGYKGPAVIGVNWYTGMFNTDSDGFIHKTGRVEGGHAIIVYSIRCVWKAGATGRTFGDLDLDKSYFVLRNSWGRGWGKDGNCKVSVRMMAELLAEDGECCIPVVRNRQAVAT